MSVPEVMNRATIAGAIEIGRAPGVVQVTFRAPVAALESAGLRALRRGAVCLNADGYAAGNAELGRPRPRPTSTAPSVLRRAVRLDDVAGTVEETGGAGVLVRRAADVAGSAGV